MAKIIKLEDKKQSISNFLKDVLKMADNGEIKKIIIIAMKEDKKDIEIDGLEKEILLGSYDLTLSEKIYLLGHFQAEISYKMTEANIDKLIEIINS